MISIIVPVFKVEKYIRRCIESILSQTINDWELLLIDDGSPDRSGAICDEYAANDCRIKVFHKQNEGVSSARNYGIKKAKGEWIVFVDSDDWVDEKYIEIFTCENVSDKTLLIQGRYNDREDGSNIDNVNFKESTFEKEQLIEGIVTNNLLLHGAPYCKFYCRKIIMVNNILFPEFYSYGEDTYFFLCYLKFINTLRLLPYQGYHYIRYKGVNLSNKLHKPDQLLCFLKDSNDAIKALDDAIGTLQSNYLVSSMALLKKTILSLYMLDYKRAERMNLLLIVKERVTLLLKIKGFEKNNFLLLQAIKHTPVGMLDLLLLTLFKVKSYK